MRHFPSRLTAILISLAAVAQPATAAVDEGDVLRVGVAGHAFDHLGNIGDQADAAAAAGFNIIYGTGFGSLGYAGLPAAGEIERRRAEFADYVARARQRGIRLAVGYVCATSIVGIDAFAAHWTPEFRARFSSPPAAWLQQDQAGRPLPSWYGGEYRPACMNNPDWRAYEKEIVRLQLSAGYDGVFFDNPTVHPQGCYCPHCMTKFGAFLAGRGVAVPAAASVDELRRLAAARREDFVRFRCTIARDFLADIRAYARTIKPHAVVTCNNSLNTPDAFYSQCRDYGYDIEQLNQAQDWATIEDMATQPRTNADGSVTEYGPVYELLQAISHGKPVVAINLVEGDYHTPANLMRLSMAEAAAHGASYLGWPTWPENVRERMAAGIRPEAEFLREHADVLNGTTARADVVLFLPFERYATSPDCKPLAISRALSAANISFRAVAEHDLADTLRSGPPTVVIESPSVLSDEQRRAVAGYTAAGGRVVYADQPDWMATLRSHLTKPSITLNGPPAVRAVVRDTASRTIVHLLNLDVRRVSSFEDKVTPAANVRVTLRVPRGRVKSVTALSADVGATRGAVPFTEATSSDGATAITVDLPVLWLSTILVVE